MPRPAPNFDPLGGRGGGVRAPVRFRSRKTGTASKSCPPHPVVGVLGARLGPVLAEGVDVAFKLGVLEDSNLRMRGILKCERVLCASPDYLAQHGTPVSPEDLAQHNCLHYSFFAGQSWHFLTPEGESLSVAVSGNLSASISSLLMDAAIKHCGIAMLPEREASSALDQGLLVPVLSALEPKPLAIHGIYQSREYQPAALRAFLDALAQHVFSG